MKPQNKIFSLSLTVFVVLAAFSIIWLGYVPSAHAANCCANVATCTIITSPCEMGGSYPALRNVYVNVNTGSPAIPVTINLTSDLDINGINFDLENQYAGASKRVVINGSVPPSTTANAKSINWNAGSVRYPSGGLVIDLSVPPTSTGNGGFLDMFGVTTSSATSSPELIIKTFAGNASGGAARTGGEVDLNFSSDMDLSGLSQIRTGANVSQPVNGGRVDLFGDGNVGVSALNANGFIDTSSSHDAGEIDINLGADSSLRAALRANSTSGVGGLIKIFGGMNYFAPSCNGGVLEAKNGGIIDINTDRLVDLPPDTATGAGGTFKISWATLSNCTCLPGGGVCWTALNSNNGTVDIAASVSCNASAFPAPNCSSSNVAPTLSISKPNGDTISPNGNFDIVYSLSDPDNTLTAALYYDNDSAGFNGTAIVSCSNVPESAGAICTWDTTGVSAGTYYVYGKVSDGVNPEAKVYSLGPLTITTSFEYSITNPADIVLITDSNTTVNVPLTKISGTSQNVNLSYSAAPAGVTFGWSGGASSCSPNPSCVPTPALMINALSAATPGSYPITITGTSVGLPNQSVDFNLTIVGANQSGNLEGFAWSDTVGWISFSSKDCDIDNNGIFEGLNEGGGATPAPLGCPVSGVAQTYGAILDVDTNYLSGFAWSENIGWISFEGASVAGCPSGVCQPRLNVAEFIGWARACSVFNTGCSGALKPDTTRGGWDGFISLHCSNTNSCFIANPPLTTAASDYKVSYTYPNLSGWAWGSEVMGWINFDGVRVRLGDNKPILTIFDQNPIDYCQKNLPGAVSLRWEYNDFEDGYGMQQAYEIEIDRSDGMLCRPGKQGDMITPNRNTTLLGTEINSFCPNFISYGGYTYTWRLRVFDSDNNFNSGSADGFISSGVSFPINGPTPAHEYPIANFSVDPSGSWIALMPITFDPFDASLAQKTESFGGTVISKLMWSFGDATSYTENPVPSPLGTGDHDVQKNDYDVGIYTVDLKVTDSDGYSCWASDRNNQKTIDIMSNKPKWNEAAP